MPASGNNTAPKKGITDSLASAMGKKIVAVWISLAVAIFATVYLVTYQEKLRLDLDRVAHIRETLSLVYDLENQLAEAESGARGFLLNGDEQQLARHREAVKEMDRAFAELYQLSAEEAGPRRLLEEMQPLIQKRQALFARAIDLARRTGVEEQERQTVARDGARLQERIRKSLEKLEDKGKKLLNPEWAREKRKVSPPWKPDFSQPSFGAPLSLQRRFQKPPAACPELVVPQ